MNCSFVFLFLCVSICILMVVVSEGVVRWGVVPVRGECRRTRFGRRLVYVVDRGIVGGILGFRRVLVLEYDVFRLRAVKSLVRRFLDDLADLRGRFGGRFFEFSGRFCFVGWRSRKEEWEAEELARKELSGAVEFRRIRGED